MSKLLPFLLLIILYSCSPASRISRQALTQVIEDSALKNAHVGIQIFDPAANKILYSYQSDKYFVPASNTKIPTCYAALKYLPDSLVSYYYSISADTIHIQPTGDPTFLHPDFVIQPSFSFLQNFRFIKIEDAGFNQFLGSGWSWNDYQEYYMAQRSLMPLYGNVVRLSWEKGTGVAVQPGSFQKAISVQGELKNGFEVARPWEENNLNLSPGNSKSASVPFRPEMETIISLLEDTVKLPVKISSIQNRHNKFIYSQVKDSMLKPMMHRSDNFFAEQSLVMTAKQVMDNNRISSIIDSILKTEFADLPQKPRWVDGSGLSRYNLFTPASLVSILNKMEKQFGIERLKSFFQPGVKAH